MGRTYERTHPWINFSPLIFDRPAIASGFCWERHNQKLNTSRACPSSLRFSGNSSKFILPKGAAATTAIEGNTLSEEEVRLHMQGRLGTAAIEGIT